jgi:hypothetical protein
VPRHEAEIAELLSGLHHVRVNVVGLDDENRDEMAKRIQKVRTTLAAQGWERIVTAQKQTEDVGIYVKTHGKDAIAGLAVVVMEGTKEAVFVNIVGNIKPEQIAMVGERLNIDPLKKMGHGCARRSHPPKTSGLTRSCALVMDSTEPAPPATAKRRIRKRYWFAAAFLGLVLVCCLGFVSLFYLRSDTRALREAALESIGGKCEKKIALHVGGLTTALARGVSSLFAIPPEARAVLQAVRSGEVGVYEVQRHRSPAVQAQILIAADKAMQSRGWTRVLGVIEKRELVAIYVPAGLSSQRMKCCLMVLDKRHLVVASVQGNAEPLLELARTHLDLEKTRRKCRSLIEVTAAD